MTTLRVTDAPAVALELALQGPPSWLIQTLWPADAYGVLGAEDKAGKTWSILDLAVSVATGTPWLDHFPVEPGPVLAFLGEGGARGMLRRLGAVIASRGGTVEDLGDLRLCFSAPQLSAAEDLAAIRAELAEHAAKLVILDPLYLSVAGAKGSDLYAMGGLLGNLQEVVAEETGAALALTTHWNKTGTGTDPSRFTGVGPTAWGRVLGSAAVERRAPDADGGSDVLLHWTFRGGEIADSEFRLRRRIRALDPSDLGSPISYAVEVTPVAHDEEAAGGRDLSWSADRVLQALETAGGDPMSMRLLGDTVAQDGQGSPLRATTIKKALEELQRAGKADGSEDRWWAMTVSPEATGSPP